MGLVIKNYSKKRLDGVIALGAVLKENEHDDLVINMLQKIADLSVEYNNQLVSVFLTWNDSSASRRSY